MLMQLLTQAGVVALLSIVVSLTPMIMGAVYAIRPTEARLALMRPLSLAGLFASLCGFCSGAINSLVGIGRAGGIADSTVWYGLSESIVSLFIGFGCLTVAWLCVALGLRRHS